MFHNLLNLKVLLLQNNKIPGIPESAFNDFRDVRFVDLSSNNLSRIENHTFQNMENLKALNISNNSIYHVSASGFLGLTRLVSLDMRSNKLTYFGHDILQHFVVLTFFDVSQNTILALNMSRGRFNDAHLVDIIYNMRGNPLLFLKPSHFSGSNKATFLVDYFAACCSMKTNVTCLSFHARPSYLTCGRLLSNVILRVTILVVGAAAVSFNLGVIVSRLVLDTGGQVQNSLIGNLGISDFIMGIAMLVLFSADLYYADYFPNYSTTWIKNPFCKTAAVLSTLSSEASVLFVGLIALDRYLGVAHPLGVHRGLGSGRMKISVVLCWFLCCLISVGPVVLDIYFPGTFFLSEVCVGLPIVKRPVSSEIADFISTTNFEYDLEQGGYFIKIGITLIFSVRERFNLL